MRGPPSSETQGRQGIYITAFSQNEPKAVTEDGLKWEATKAFGHDAVNVYLKGKVKSLSHVQLFATPWTVACQAPLPMEFSRQEHWSGCHFFVQGFF